MHNDRNVLIISTVTRWHDRFGIGTNDKVALRFEDTRAVLGYSKIIITTEKRRCAFYYSS